MRKLTLLAVAIMMVGLMAGPAAAHILVVTPPGHDEAITGWVGGGPLPEQAKGQGLIPGGPTGEITQPPSHGHGLNTACEAIRGNPSGAGVVDIFGPGGPNCPHGS